VEYSEDKVLNFSFKDDLKFQIPKGQAALSSGYENRYEIAANILSMNKRTKLYDIINLDNTGSSSRSRSNYLTGELSESYLNSDVVSGELHVSSINRANVQSIENKSEYNSFHFAHNPSSKLQFTGQIIFDNARNTFNDSNKTLYFDSLRIDEASFLTTKPQIWYGVLKMKYDISNNMMLTYKGKFDADKTTVGNTLFVPDKYIYDTYGKNRFQTNNLELTIAQTDSSVAVINISSLADDNSQQFDYYQSLDTKEIEQQTEATTFRYTASVDYHKRQQKNFLYTATAGFIYDDRDFCGVAYYNSIRDEHSVSLSNMLAYIDADFTRIIKKSTFSLATLLGYRQQIINSTKLNSHSDKRIELYPRISYSLELGYNTFSMTGSYRQGEYSLMDYAGYFTGYREFKGGAETYNYGSQLSFGAKYVYFNKSNGSSANIIYAYSVENNTFTGRNDISLKMNNYSLLSGKDSKSHLLNVGFNKYIDAVRHGIKSDNTIMATEYFNAVNSEELRKNNSLFGSSKLTLKSVFDIPVNYIVGVNFNYSSFRTDDLPSINYFNYSLFQDLLYKPNKKLLVKISFDEHFLGKERKCYLFICPNIEYSFKNSDLSAGISAYNILNHSRITEYSINDYYSTESYYSVVPAMYLLNFSFRF
jgi:hypothetical protein